ncbi:MAG: TRAP transporter substrate-binding protein [Silicimonas sp.]|nr:TRAP transporter substrate-binding protein [Silicimonas sp.]NNF92367.1 TRAP transporter substrate-binding protein [Boseongicola sp.]RZW01398.1 MAG: C4-dicarboxylate ABC transporter substrate-binding protein [Paracoccaceae bacterium]MBT8423992.1 TRAP transporter substrate-binding protein [Silicimonas sp.]NND19921.1 TRAP transporter substrate-binding protein [Silicimonas sp.]
MTKIKTIVAASAVAVAGGAASAETWDMPMAYAATNFHSEVGASFAACVTDGTGGELEIVTHPSGSLFPGNEIKRAVQTGQANIGERLLSAHENENPLYGVDSIPFLVSSFDEHEKLWEIAGPKVAEVLAEDNLHYLYSVPWPPQGLYFRDPVESVADMQGVKFRSYSTATARLAELTGMLPVQIEAAEISQAFATGVADSMISSGATGYDRKVWEHLNHFYVVDAWLPRNAVFANMDAWNGLDDASKAVVNDCAAAAKADGLQRSKEYTDFTLNGLREGGMSVEPASDTLVGELQAIGATMTEEWLAVAGDVGNEIVDAYKAAN